jgi:NitT/TauT family transport system substrate-binding protein
MRRRALLRSLLAPAALLLTGCDIGPKYEPPLRIGTGLWPGYTPLHIARDRGLFGETEVKIATFSTDYDASRAFRDGRIEVLCGTLGDTLRSIDQGNDVRIVLVLDFSNGADGIAARPEITKISDLRGKRVAVEVGTLTHFVLIRALEMASLNESDVTLKNLGMDEATAALGKGDVDAAALWEPFLTKAERGGARRVFSSAEIPGEILDVLAVRTDALRDRPRDVDRIIQAWGAALDLVRQRPHEAEPIMMAQLDMSAQELHESLAELELVDLAQNLELFDAKPPRPSVRTSYAQVAAFMAQHKLLTHPARAAEDIIDPAPLRRVLSR